MFNEFLRPKKLQAKKLKANSKWLKADCCKLIAINKSTFNSSTYNKFKYSPINDIMYLYNNSVYLIGGKWIEVNRITPLILK